MPKRIQVRVQDTLDGLDTGTRLLLETTAALGRSFRLEDAAMLLGKSPAALLPAVDQALAATVLVAKQDQLSFRHELVWQAISTALPLPIRQALHRQIAEMLLARGSAASAAAHLLMCARSGDSAALAGLDRAAVEVLPSSPAIAADLAARALELTPPGDPKLIPRSLTAAQALTSAGRFAEATDLTCSVLALPLPAATTARLRCVLSSALWMSGQATEALVEAERVLAEPQLPGELRADAKITLLHCLVGLRHSRRAGLLAESILAAPEQESVDVVITALVARAMILWDAGRLSEALALSADAIRLTTDQQPGVRRCHPHLFLATRLVDLRRFDAARSVMRAAHDWAGLLGQPGWSATPATLRARMSLAAGRLEEAEAEAEAELSVATALGSHLHGSGALAILATAALRRGDLNAAVRHTQSPQAWGPGPAYADTWDTVVAAQVEEAKRGPKAAVKMLTDVYAEIGDTPVLADVRPGVRGLAGALRPGGGRTGKGSGRRRCRGRDLAHQPAPWRRGRRRARGRHRRAGSGPSRAGRGRAWRSMEPGFRRGGSRRTAGRHGQPERRHRPPRAGARRLRDGRSGQGRRAGCAGGCAGWAPAGGTGRSRPGRRPAGPASPEPSARCPSSSPRDPPTGRSPSRCSSACTRSPSTCGSLPQARHLVPGRARPHINQNRTRTHSSENRAR